MEGLDYSYFTEKGEWSEEEDKIVRMMYLKENASVIDIGIKLKRAIGSVMCRLKSLKIIEDRNNVRGYEEYKNSELYKQAIEYNSKNKNKKRNKKSEERKLSDKILDIDTDDEYEVKPPNGDKYKDTEYEYYINKNEWSVRETRELILEYARKKELLYLCKKFRRLPIEISKVLRELDIVERMEDIYGYDEYKNSELFKNIILYGKKTDEEKMKILSEFKKINGISKVEINGMKKIYECKNKNCNGFNMLNNLCLKCFKGEYEIKKNCKVKELTTVNEILKYFDKENYNWSINEPFEKTNIVIDLQLYLEDRTILIEINERKQTGYNKEDEDKRMKAILDVKTKNIIMIRFNPDNYVDDKTKFKIPSCWYRKRVRYVENWNLRLKTLFDLIEQSMICNFDGRDYMIHYLFYK
jgi:hypothetical protein